MKYLLPQKTWYKANLHTHSTVSDGTLTPEQVKEAYKEKGYSVLALTDHSAMIPHNDLTEPDFLMLTGTELDMPAKDSQKTCHLCLLSRDPRLQWIPFRDGDVLPHMQAYMDECRCDGMAQEHSTENINAVIARANDLGMLVTYNHPVWSLEYHEDYAPLEGLWAMEYRNGGTFTAGFDENNGWVFREFAHLGKFLLPIMADDTHHTHDPRNGQPCLGVAWTMVAADRLEYGCVMEALAKGQLYSSCGPQIHSLTWDGEKVRIQCSAAARIQLISYRRRSRAIIGQDLEQAEFTMKRWLELSKDDPLAWFQLMVTDADGGYAVTRAYRPSDLCK